jgi:hypothetical protein
MSLLWLFLSGVGRRLMEFGDRRLEKRDPAPRPIIESIREAWF